MSFLSSAFVKPYRSRNIRAGGIAATIALGALLGYRAYSIYQMRVDEANIAILNEKVWAYKEKVGTLPDLNLIDLYHHGLTKERLHRTPFGGFYRLNPKQPAVFNPNLVSR